MSVKIMYKEDLDAPRTKNGWWYTLKQMDGRFFYHLNCSDWRSFAYHIKDEKFSQRGGGTMILPKTIEKEFMEKIKDDAEKYNFDENGNLRRIEIIDFDGSVKTRDDNEWSKTTLVAMGNSNRFIHKIIYNGEVIYRNDVYKEQS